MTFKYKPLACGHHSHLDIGSLDSGSTAETKIKYAAKIERIADACTDHGTMSTLATHWMVSEKLAKDKKNPIKIKSIHGIELYIFDPHRKPKPKKGGGFEPQYMHLTVHFKTQEAYQYFCKMTPKMEERALVRWGERKPLMYLEELEPIAGQIAISSSCLVGPIMKNVMQGRSDWARENYIRLRNLAGPGNWHVEVFPHLVSHQWVKPVYSKPESGKSKKLNKEKEGYFEPIKIARRDDDAIDPAFEIDPCTGYLDIQKGPNEFVIAMAKEFNDPVIISLDDHFAAPEDKIVQDVRLGNGKESWKFYNSLHMLTSEEAANTLIQQLNVAPRDIEEWIDNSYKFVELFDKYTMATSKDRWLLPKPEMVYPDIKTSNKEKLLELVEKHGRMPKIDSSNYQTYKERFDYEVSVLSDNGVADFLPYFFVLEDVVSYAKSQDILVNTRGSAGGSLVCFLLGISITDPIRYELPFERFLTLGRIKANTMPDIDLDVEDRNRILAYLTNKYGDHFGMIATDMMLRLKTSILDCERAINGSVSAGTSDLCWGLKGADQGQTDKDWLYGYTDKDTGEVIEGFITTNDPYAEKLRQYKESNPEIWSAVERCLGITKTRGIHAGGVIITPGPVQSYMPLLQTGKGMVTAYNMKAVEYVGGIKYDLLGLSTLEAISTSIKALRKDGIVDLKWEEWPHQDDVFTEIIHKNLLTGIFQINTDTVAPYVKQIKPKNTKEIAILTSLVRPGALDSPSPDPKDNEKETAASYFVKCSMNKRQPYYIHSDLVPILGDTYGVIVLQEQALRIFRDLAGYTYETAEFVRRAIGKKDAALLKEHGLILKEKCMVRGWTEEQATRLFDSIVASSRYSFNYAHSASYGIVAYNGAYLKRNYPLYFWKGILSINTQDHDTLRDCMHECSHLLLPVDILRSDPVEWKIEGDKLRPPLMVIKGCGDKGSTNVKKFIETPLNELNLEDIIEKEEETVNE